MNDGAPSGGGSMYSAPAAACAADILKMLAAEGRAMGAAEIARTIKRSRSLVFRVLHELETRDFVERREANKYWLGVSALEVGGAFAARAEFSSSANRVLRELSEDTGETTNLAVLSGSKVVYLMRNEGRNSIVTVSHVGQRLPASCCALGKAMLAELSDTRVRTLFRDGLRRVTSHSITSMDELLVDLAAVRERGYAIDEGETLLGRSCLGVHVQLPGHQSDLGAISISTTSEVFAKRRKELLGALLQAKRRLDAEAVGVMAMST